MNERQSVSYYLGYFTGFLGFVVVVAMLLVGSIAIIIQAVDVLFISKPVSRNLPAERPSPEPERKNLVRITIYPDRVEVQSCSPEGCDEAIRYPAFAK